MSSTQKFKKKVRNRNNKCAFCGISNDAHCDEYGQKLHVHRLIPSRAGGEYERNNVVVVCTQCHRTLERTQSQALENLKHDNHKEQVDELEQQRDTLLDRVEALERLIRDPEFYAEIIGEPIARGELVAKQFGRRSGVFNDAEDAREAYEEWGGYINRVSLRATKSDVVEYASRRLNDRVKRIERMVEDLQR